MFLAAYVDNGLEAVRSEAGRTAEEVTITVTQRRNDEAQGEWREEADTRNEDGLTDRLVFGIMERQGAWHRVCHVASAVSAYFQGGEEPRAELRVLGVWPRICTKRRKLFFQCSAW